MVPTPREPRSFDAQAFADLAEELHRTGDPARTAEQVVATAVEVLGADHASITMSRRAGKLQTIAPTDPLAAQLDELQYEVREGPCYEASQRGETLLITNLATQSRWPTWGPKAAANGVASLMSVELGTHDRRIGALNLYFHQRREFDDDDIGFAQIFGRHAALAVANEFTIAQLVTALDSRKLIGQAQGILMERHGLSDSQAFEVLKRYSTTSNVKLREVAEYVVSTRKLPPA